MSHTSYLRQGHLLIGYQLRAQAAGTARPSIAKTLLEEAMSTGSLDAVEEQEIACALGILYAGMHHHSKKWTEC